MLWIWIGLAALLVWLVLRRAGLPLSSGEPPSPEPETPQVEAPAGPPHRLPIEDCLDLHTFSPRDVVAVTDEYLREAWKLGFTEVRLIHGKGTGFQRERIRKHLSSHPLVLRFGDAPPERGGWGATLVRLTGGKDAKRTGGAGDTGGQNPRQDG